MFLFNFEGCVCFFIPKKKQSHKRFFHGAVVFILTIEYICWVANVVAFAQQIPATLISAITKDLNENGLIDHIDLQFTRDVLIDTMSASPYFTVSYNGVSFLVNSVSQGVNSAKYSLALVETTNSTSLQSSLQPVVGQNAGSPLKGKDRAQKKELKLLENKYFLIWR
jgi:hypothetical protein